MNKKNFLLLLIFILFLFNSAFSKKCPKCANSDICQNNQNLLLIQKLLMDEPPLSSQIKKQVKEQPKYFFKDKNIEKKIDGLKLQMNFTGIQQYESANPNQNFQVVYSVNFYDKEKLGFDNIQAQIKGVSPLYSHSLTKKGEETKNEISWEVDIKANDKKTQVVQLIAEASFEETKELYVYNSFTFKYGEKVKRDYEFWVIFFCFIGMVIITYIALYIYLCLTNNMEMKIPSISNKDLNDNSSHNDSQQMLTLSNFTS